MPTVFRGALPFILSYSINLDMPDAAPARTLPPWSRICGGIPGAGPSVGAAPIGGGPPTPGAARPPSLRAERRLINVARFPSLAKVICFRSARGKACELNSAFGAQAGSCP
jgi:hypothetical protein